MQVTKKEFIQQLVDNYHYTKKSATTLVEDFCSLVLENLEEGNAVYFYGFGCFDMIMRATRSCPNPQTGEKCVIPAHWVPKFVPGQSMKRAVKMYEDNEKKGIK